MGQQFRELCRWWVVMRWCALWLGGFGLWGCWSPVVHELTQGEAREVVLSLEEGGVVSREVREGRTGRAGGGWRVEVPSRDRLRALGWLDARGLPRPGPVAAWGSEGGLAGLGMPPGQWRAARCERVAGQLRQSLLRMPDVADVQVHLAPGEGARTGGQSRAGPPVGGLWGTSGGCHASSASVAVQMLGLESAPGGAADLAMQRLVAGAVSGLEPGAVAVVRTQRRRAALAKAPGGLLAVEGTGRNSWLWANALEDQPLRAAALGLGLGMVGLGAWWWVRRKPVVRWSGTGDAAGM